MVIKYEFMGFYISELPPRIDMSFVDGFLNKSDETIIQITIAGPYNYELEEALDCIYMDHKRTFELVQIKRSREFIGAMIIMKSKNRNEIK